MGNCSASSKPVLCFVTDAGKALAATLGTSFYKCDISNPKEVEDMVAGVVAEFGSLDVMVNNAGTRSPNHLIGDMPVDEWERVMAINTNGTFYGIKFACAQMAKQETGGAICNISSIAGLAGYPSIAPYTASKGCMNALTRSVALEYAKKKIRVNSVCPSAVNTPLLEDYINAAPDPKVPSPRPHTRISGHLGLICSLPLPFFLIVDAPAAREHVPERLIGRAGGSRLHGVLPLWPQGPHGHGTVHRSRRRLHHSRLRAPRRAVSSASSLAEASAVKKRCGGSRAGWAPGGAPGAWQAAGVRA